MYLILYPTKNLVGNSGYFESRFTTEVNEVSESLMRDGVRVFKMDNLTEIEEIHVTYEEKFKL